jgi:hypothetical protein
MRLRSDGPASQVALTKTGITTLERIVTGTPAPSRKTVSHYLTRIAKLGGYLARKGDPPPGNMVMWRGMTRLANIVMGMSIAKGNCG